VVIAVGLLGAAIFFFFLNRGPSAGSSPSPVATLATPGATSGIEGSPSGSVGSSGLPSPSTPGSSPGPTPKPTLYVPQVMTGPGYITFGTTVDSQLNVTDPKTVFAVDEPMVWVANLTQPADSVDLKINIYKLDAKQPTGEKLVRVDDVMPVATGAQVYFRRLRPIGATLGTGLFTIQYVRGQDILASSSFLVQQQVSSPPAQ